MPIEIFKGVVSDLGESGMIRAAMSFSVGDPPVRFYCPGGDGTLFSNGEYIAVAGKRTFIVPGVTHVALAYRRLGSMGSAHFMGVMLPGGCILFGIIGVLGDLFLGPLNIDLKVFAAGLVALGAFGLWRLWSIRKACRMLELLPSVISTYSQS